MELKKGGQTLVGYPALIDKGGDVEMFTVVARRTRGRPSPGRDGMPAR